MRVRLTYCLKYDTGDLFGFCKGSALTSQKKDPKINHQFKSVT